MSMRDDLTYQLAGKGKVCIRMYHGTLRELKELRYIPRMMKNLISVGALEVEALKGTLGEGVLKMSSGLLVILEGIRCNNVYYLMCSAVTGLTSSGQLDGDHGNSGHRQVGLKSRSSIGRCIDLSFGST